MSNNTYHYFGAYLEIKVKETETLRYFRGCDNGHPAHTRHCGQCGLETREQTKTVKEYPTWIDQLLEEKWLDFLGVITPPKIYQTGVIIAVGNLGKDRGEWLHLGRHERTEQIKEFPSGDDITKLVSTLTDNYTDIIAMLKKSESVISVKVKAGYVLDVEY